MRLRKTIMKLPRLNAVIEKEGKWFVATCPELGVASQGLSFDEAEDMIREAVKLLLEEADEAEIRRRLNRGVKVKRLELAHA
jgi:predicted RNase H-like HicB family nuclease